MEMPTGVVEIDRWGSTIDNLEQPDRLIFDLDPGEHGHRSGSCVVCASGICATCDA